MSTDPNLSPEVRGKLRQFNRILISYIDFQQAGGIAKYILKSDLYDRYPEDRFVLQGLNCSMILAYCRPFSGSGRGGADRLPSLPERFLRLLSGDEKKLHEIVMTDRNTVLAHSDSEAWEMEPQLIRAGGRELLTPIHNYTHAPLAREATEQLQAIADKLREACFEERRRLEPVLKPHFRVIEYDEAELQRVADKLGLELP